MEKLAASTSPVKNANDAKLFLKQRSLIALENNYNIETLANLLISTSFEARVPDHVASIICVVSFLMVGETQNTFAEELTATVAEKLLNASVQITKQIDHEREFLAASTASQAEQTQKITELMNSFIKVSRILTTTSHNLSSTANNITKSVTDFQPAIQALSALAEHMMSIAESAKALAKAVDNFKNPPPPPPQPPQQSSQSTQSSYSSSKNCPNVWPFCNVWVITQW